MRAGMMQLEGRRSILSLRDGGVTMWVRLPAATAMEQLRTHDAGTTMSILWEPAAPDPLVWNLL